MEISTSLGAILHKPDWNLHKPGSDSPQARSPRSTHPPRFVPKTFSFAYPTFSFAPTDFFVCPPDFSEAGKRQFSGEGISRRRNAPHRQIRFPSIPVDSAPRARTPPPRGGHCGGFIETALPRHHAAVSSKPPYRATTRRFHRNRPTLRIYPFAVAIG